MHQNRMNYENDNEEEDNGCDNDVGGCEMMWYRSEGGFGGDDDGDNVDDDDNRGCDRVDEMMW